MTWQNVIIVNKFASHRVSYYFLSAVVSLSGFIFAKRGGDWTSIHLHVHYVCYDSASWYTHWCQCEVPCTTSFEWKLSHFTDTLILAFIDVVEGHRECRTQHRHIKLHSTTIKKQRTIFFNENSIFKSNSDQPYSHQVHPMRIQIHPGGPCPRLGSTG